MFLKAQITFLKKGNTLKTTNDLRIPEENVLKYIIRENLDLIGTFFDVSTFHFLRAYLNNV